MKKYLVLSLALTLSACNLPAFEKQPEACVKLSDITPFYRCETKELVGYGTNDVKQFWLKTAPAHAAAPAPAAVPSPLQPQVKSK